MKCEFCANPATEKHHISYFPEMTIGVCAYHGDQVHIHPFQYGSYIRYRRGDASIFYDQKSRIDKFCENMSRARRLERRRMR